MEKSDCKVASEVYREEVDVAIRARRKYWDENEKERDPNGAYPMPSKADLVGVALSGGGIRSAMFNLGLLQAFERCGLMKHVDYLASVSGGGYTNGYYTTLRNSQKNRAQEREPGSASGNQLSPRDTQFLLDGQYLNRPIEFLTTYLARTAIMVVTMMSLLIAMSSLVAMFFRCFDYPEVRIWFRLLDLNTDLRVGLFSCAVAAGTVLIGRCLVLNLLQVRATPLRTNPGQWAVIVIAAFMLGISIMIGNGDFAVSAGTGWLPQKIDLSKLQLPIAIAVMVLLSPMLRFSSLLKSERVNASWWQKLALALILGGTTWGAVFAMVGWMGQEDVSGFIKNRPPHFVRYDILNHDEFAELILSSDEFTSVVQQAAQNAKRKDADQSMQQLARDLKHSVKKGRDADEALRSEKMHWYSWTQFSNYTIRRWIQTIAARITSSNEGKIHEYVEADATNARVGQQLLQFIEIAIRPTQNSIDGALTAPIQQHAESFRSLDPDRLKVTKSLLTLASHRIAAAPTSQSSVDLKKIDEQLNLMKEFASGKVPSLQTNSQEARIRQIVDWWISGGGKMIKKNGERYKDLASFHTLFEKCWVARDRFAPEHLSIPEIWQLNRMFLEIAYPNVFKERAMVSTPVVVGEDQEFRLFALICATACFAVCVALLDLNWVCAWFHFYRKRIGETFLVNLQGQGGLLLKELKPYEVGAPYPLFVAGMLLPQAPVYNREFNSDTHDNPTKLDGSFASNWYSFLFSPLYCGWLPCGRQHQRTYKETGAYLSPQLRVDDAVVLSGAAVTPYMSSNTSMRLLMHLFNFRLEQWMPNPELERPRNRRFSLLNLAFEWYLSRTWTGPTNAIQKPSWRYAVIADGGFREFLGVEELVARRCKIVIVSDAGCNNGLYEFGVLAELIRKMRLDHSIEILDLDHDRPLDTRRLRRTPELDGKSPQHFVLGRIRYPERLGQVSTGEENCDESGPKQEALLVYLQMSLTGDEDIDIEQFRRTNPNFPDEPIANQFYTREQVESFRQLGEHIGSLLCRDVSQFGSPDASLSQSESCGSMSVQQRLQAWRIQKLEDAFRSNYRNECRQEATVCTDDARMGWFIDVDYIEHATLRSIYKFESPTDHSHQLLIRDFVWYTLDSSKAGSLDRFQAITPADIYGMAVECNRRHAGFRPEWPTSFFQICGRDLLTKAAQKAEFLFSYCQPAESGMDDFLVWYSTGHPHAPIPSLIDSISRLAVMLPRGVFRRNGARTAADVLTCLLNYIIRIKLGKLDDSLDWVTCERSQRLLIAAIRTGKALEVERVLGKLLYIGKRRPPTQTAPVKRE